MNIFFRDQIMRVMQGHRGRANAMPRKVLLAELRLYRPSFTDRDCRELYSDLPLCSCEEGIFFPIYSIEVQEFRIYLEKKVGPIIAARRCNIIYAYYPNLRPNYGIQQELFR